MKILLIILTVFVIFSPLSGQSTEANVEQIGITAKSLSGYVNDVQIEQKNGPSNLSIVYQKSYSQWNQALGEQIGSNNQMKIFQISGQHNEAEVKQEGNNNFLGGSKIDWQSGGVTIFFGNSISFNALVDPAKSSFQGTVFGSNNLKVAQQGGENQIGLTQGTIWGNNIADITQNGSDICEVFQLNLIGNNYNNMTSLVQNGNDYLSLKMVNVTPTSSKNGFANKAIVEQNGNNYCEITLINNNSSMGNSISVIQPENGPKLRITQTR